MMNGPVRFNRLSAAFDEGAKIRSCPSNDSDHFADLSDLVISFHEREFRDQRKVVEEDWDGNEDDEDLFESKHSLDVDIRDSLKNLLNYENDVVRLTIQAEVEKAMQELGGSSKTSSLEFKRRLMARLRDRGFDAGLCKSKWEKKGGTPLGEYEYIDINAKGTRYIIEVFLAGEFTIARPTSFYTSLLQLFPPVFVGEQDELKQIVRLMCNAIRKSMKSVDFYVPPWRRLAYLQAKWFGSIKRTTNEVLSQKESVKDGGIVRNIVNGYMPAQGISFYGKEDFGSRSSRIRVGNLSLELNQR